MCACCRATEFDSVDVELECDDGYIFKKKIAVPKVCSCEDGCLLSEPEVERRTTKKKVKYGVKTG